MLRASREYYTQVWFAMLAICSIKKTTVIMRGLNTSSTPSSCISSLRQSLLMFCQNAPTTDQKEKDAMFLDYSNKVSAIEL